MISPLKGLAPIVDISVFMAYENRKERIPRSFWMIYNNSHVAAEV